MNKMITDDSDSEEEILVYAEFEDSVNIDKYRAIHILGADEKNPIIQLDETFFMGKYENALGTYMFFEEDATIQGKDPLFDKYPDKGVRYVCKTRKLVSMEHAYVTPKEGKETNPQNKVNQKENDDVHPVMFRDIEQAREAFKSYFNIESSNEQNCGDLSIQSTIEHDSGVARIESTTEHDFDNIRIEFTNEHNSGDIKITSTNKQNSNDFRIEFIEGLIPIAKVDSTNEQNPECINSTDKQNSDNIAIESTNIQDLDIAMTESANMQYPGSSGLANKQDVEDI